MGIYYRRALEFVGNSNLLPKVPNFDIRLLESGEIRPPSLDSSGLDAAEFGQSGRKLARFGQNGRNPAGSDRIRPNWLARIRTLPDSIFRNSYFFRMS